MGSRELLETRSIGGQIQHTPRVVGRRSFPPLRLFSSCRALPPGKADQYKKLTQVRLARTGAEGLGCLSNLMAATPSLCISWVTSPECEEPLTWDGTQMWSQTYKARASVDPKDHETHEADMDWENYSYFVCRIPEQ